MSDKVKYERQKALARERQRRMKERMNEEQLEEKRKYDRERMARLRVEKKVKKIEDMNPREQRKQRKYWRERNKVRSLRNKALNEVMAVTLPASPVIVDKRESSQKKRGQKKIRKDNVKSYRTILNLQAKHIKSLEKRLEKYKKSLQNEKEKNKAVQASPSPRKQVTVLLGREKVSPPPPVKKQLFLGFALRKQIERQTKKCK